MSSAPFIGKSLWGVCEAGDVSKWDDLFARIKAEGYFAVETICHFDLNLDPAKFRECLDKNNLELVIQIHTASDWSKFDYCTSCELDDHLQSFRQLVVDALVHSPNMINCHSGHDSWDVPTAVDYFRQVLAIEQELLVGKYADVVLVHETHRQRLLSNPYVTRDILSSPHLSALKVSLSLSLSLRGYYSILVVSCVMWSAALDSYVLRLSYSYDNIGIAQHHHTNDNP